MRRVITFLIVATVSAGGVLWWLHDGDLGDAVQPVLAHWDADTLALDAGVVSQEDPATP